MLQKKIGHWKYNSDSYGIGSILICNSKIHREIRKDKDWRWDHLLYLVSSSHMWQVQSTHQSCVVCPLKILFHNTVIESNPCVLMSKTWMGGTRLAYVPVLTSITALSPSFGCHFDTNAALSIFEEEWDICMMLTIALMVSGKFSNTAVLCTLTWEKTPLPQYILFLSRHAQDFVATPIFIPLWF